MIVLYIFLGLLALPVALLLAVLGILLGVCLLLLPFLCVPVVAEFTYQKQVKLRVRWLFFTLLQAPSTKKKKPKKPKKEKAKKDKPEKKPEEKKPKEEKEKKPNAFKRFYTYQGISGFVELLQQAVYSLGRFGKGVWNAFCIRELWLHVMVTGGDPKDLMDKYGKTCAAVFPPLGWLSTHLHSRRGAVRANIYPDFLGREGKEIACRAVVSVSPLVLLAAVVMLALRLGFQVVLKFFRGARPPKEDKPAKAAQDKAA